MPVPDVVPKVGKRFRVNRFGVGLLATSIFFCIGCGEARLEPSKRPLGVPATATWAGGGDGGAYILCTVNRTQDVDRCSIWNDNNGYLLVSGSFRLDKEKRAASESELKYAGAANGTIYLKDGRTLSSIESN